MDSLPVRGERVRSLGFPLPPARMPLMRAGRPLKRWRYVGVYTPGLMLCVGEARVAGVPQRWWAVAFPDGRLVERTTNGRGGVSIEGNRVRVETRDASIDLTLHDAEPVEVVSPHGRSWIWTAKRAPVEVHGRVTVGAQTRELGGEHGFIDDSAGYHARHTAWRWSAGIGRATDGRRVAWNLVDGVHDAATDSERTVWVDGAPVEVPPVEFAADLSRVAPDLAAGAGLEFREWSRREHHANRGLVRSRYSQPFGEFSGELPGGVRLAEGFGVMEDHEVWW